MWANILRQWLTKCAICALLLLKNLNIRKWNRRPRGCLSSPLSFDPRITGDFDREERRLFIWL
jgi:hypothetical protein